MQGVLRAGLPALCLLAVGCSQSAGGSPGPMPSGGGTGGSSASGGSGGSLNQAAGGGGDQGTTAGSAGALVAGSGGAAAIGGGDSGGNPSGTGGNAGGTGGNAGGDAAGSGGGVTVARDFSCTLIIGCYQTSQWFDGGFESAVGTAKWEIKWDHYTFTENWANPADKFWDVPIASQCTSNASMPDRVLFIAYSMTLSTESEWEAQFSKVVDNIKAKFASVKQIELLGMVRAPNDQACPGNSDVSILVGPGEDQAMQAVADKSAGMVKVGPKYFAPSCSSFTTNNTNLTTAAATTVAQSLVTAYK